MTRLFRKMIAVTLVAAIACLSINTVSSTAHEIQEAGLSSPPKLTIDFFTADTSDHCPACPGADHPGANHCHISCDHHTCASFSVPSTYDHPVPVALAIVNVEPFQYIPKVFPAVDTPPHILT